MKAVNINEKNKYELIAIAIANGLRKLMENNDVKYITFTSKPVVKDRCLTTHTELISIQCERSLLNTIASEISEAIIYPVTNNGTSLIDLKGKAHVSSISLTMIVNGGLSYSFTIAV